MGEAESLAGRVLAEKYLLIDRLGEGGFGSIWRAEHQVLRSPVAVKLIDLNMARKDGAVERFLREAQATAALRSPHVVQVLDYGVDGDQPFIVMELMEGENLAERVARVGPLPPIEVVRIVTHVARAMGKAHELGIVHRDLKPENIFLVSNGDDEVAKVLDFGVAKFAAPVAVNQNSYTITGSLIGTPYYMSPEQAQGNKAVDHRSDLWALGVIAFEMMTGKRPFDGDALGDLVLTICVRSIAVPSAVAKVPAGFDAWFARSVEREPDARFQSAREMALALLRVIEGEEAEGRYANIEDRLSQKPSNADAEVGVDIPSRPAASAFAQTIRDDGLASGILSGGSLVPPALATASATRTNSDEPEPPEHLTPWSVAGIAVVALAAGAAAVYGVFFLVRAHDTSNDTVETAISAPPHSKARPTVSGSSKRHFDVTASSKPNSPTEPAIARTQRSPTESAQDPSKRTSDSARANSERTAGALVPATIPVTSGLLPPAMPVPAVPPPPALPVPLAPTPPLGLPVPLAPTPPSASPAPAAPPDDLAPVANPAPAPIPALSAGPQSLAAPPIPAPNEDAGLVPTFAVTPSVTDEAH
jgi:eukaryotic-like serine/threonine-protein kinase